MKKIGIILLLWLALFSFWKINNLNYIKHNQIKINLVQHPEWLPTKEFAKKTSFGFQNLKADIYWLETIQYIGWNAIHSEYKKYLFTILDLITELNPYFEHPYKIGLLLLPDYNERYEDLTDKQQNEYLNQTEKIWLKWIANFCDPEKIELIKNEANLVKIWTDEKYKNPCKSFDIPYYLAFVYYFNLNNPLEASNYYKIASAQSDSLEGAKIMAAIMQWKWGNREKSFFMFTNMAKSQDTTEEQICATYVSELEQVWALVFDKKIKLDWKLLKQINTTRDQSIWKYDEDQEKPLLSETECSNYVRKATRELNLYYIEQANIKYKENNDWKSAINAKILYNKWYIDYLPIDYQQYEDYGVIYEYNEDTWNFDYDMGKY